MNASCFIRVLFLAAALTVSFVSPHIAGAHCDTLDGPVVATAKKALETGDITPLLKWVKKEKEGEIKKAFQKTLAVRALLIPD